MSTLQTQQASNTIQSSKLDLLHTMMDSMPDLIWDTSVSAEDAMCWTDEEKEQVVLTMCGPTAQIDFIMDLAENLGMLEDVIEFDEAGDWTDNFMWEQTDPNEYGGEVPTGCASICAIITTNE
jgi:hypothetical protein